jgi:hypothetical protein
MIAVGGVVALVMIVALFMFFLVVFELWRSWW